MRDVTFAEYTPNGAFDSFTYCLTSAPMDLNSLNIEAAAEFVKVLDLLGDTINAEELATKLQNKFS